MEEVKRTDGLHVNPDGETDVEKGAKLGAAGGAVVGAIAGAATGPLGALLGAAIGGAAGAAGSGLAVAAVDQVDGDDAIDRPVYDLDRPVETPAGIPNGTPGIQTGGHANDGTPDSRGMMEKAADAMTGDRIDDKTGKVVSGAPTIVDNGMPGVQTGGRANDGTPDTRGVWEKTADAVTGDVIDDKTGKPVTDDPYLARASDPRERTADTITGDRFDNRTGRRPVDDVPPPLIDNGIPGIQTGGRAVDGTPDTRGVSEKVADAVTGDNYDDKTGKRVD